MDRHRKRADEQNGQIQGDILSRTDVERDNFCRTDKYREIVIEENGHIQRR